MAQKVAGKVDTQSQSRSRKKPYFDELIDRQVEVLTKYREDGAYHIYKGVFLCLERNYLWLENCKVATVKSDGSIEDDPHIYPRVALNQAIVAQIRLF